MGPESEANSMSYDNVERQGAPKIGFVSLGCPKALTDSELILTQLRAEGYDTSKTCLLYTSPSPRD